MRAFSCRCLLLSAFLGLLVDLSECWPQPTPVVPQADLYVFVVDRSGSISENRLVDPIAKAVSDFIGTLTQESEVRIIFFNQAASPPKVWKGVDLKAKSELYRYFTETFKPQGNTRLYDTVGEVINILKADASRYKRINVIILSDGEDNRSQTYKGWQDLEPLAGPLVQSWQQAYIAWYTLGFPPKDRPSDNGVIHLKEYPNPQELRIAVPPRAQFLASPKKVRPNEEVQFSLISASGVESTQWDFGDGTKIDTQEVSVLHKFTKEGAYTVSAKVVGEGGEDIKIIENLVNVIRIIPLEAKFQWLPKDIRTGEEVAFIDESTGAPEKWHWVVEGIGESDQRLPKFTFTNPGSYVVNLRVEKEAQESEAKLKVEVKPPRPNPDFVCTPTELQIGQAVKLKALQTGQNWKHNWTVAGSITLRGAEVSWEVDQAGLLEVVHQVESPGGMSYTSGHFYVKTPDQPKPPVARFEVSARKGTSPLEIEFKDRSKGEIVSYNYEFGDGQSSDMRNPRHRYDKPGTYRPRLRVVDATGNSARDPGEIEIQLKKPLAPATLWALRIVGAILFWVLLFKPLVLSQLMLPHRGAKLHGSKLDRLRTLASKKRYFWQWFWPRSWILIGYGKKHDVDLSRSASSQGTGTCARIKRRLFSGYNIDEIKSGTVHIVSADPVTGKDRSEPMQGSRALKEGDRFLIGGQKFEWQFK